MAIDHSDRAHKCKHMVVRRILMLNGAEADVLCYTDKGEPAVYHDASTAELRCAELSEREPWARLRVISFPVL